MFLVPNAIFHGSPDITVGLYVWKGIIPALLGNIVGGGFFVGCLYYYLHLQGQPECTIDGDGYESAASHSVGGKKHDITVVKGDEKV